MISFMRWLSGCFSYSPREKNVNKIKKRKIMELKLLDKSFVSNMEKELLNNQHKGDWQEWKPSYNQFCEELDHHVNKLKVAINYCNYKDIEEFSADLANLAEKAYTTFKE